MKVKLAVLGSWLIYLAKYLADPCGLGHTALQRSHFLQYSRELANDILGTTFNQAGL